MDPNFKPEQRTVTVSAEAAGARLDRVLADGIAELSRTRLKGLVQAGCVRLDGQPVAKPGTPVAAGQVIEVELRDIRPMRLGSEELGLVVLHEDDDVIVINKAPRMLAHPAPGVEGGTVSDFARERYGELPTLQGVDRPGIVHRLDAGTSGVMVLGRSKSAFKSLMSQFRARTVEKSTSPRTVPGTTYPTPSARALVDAKCAPITRSSRPSPSTSPAAMPMP